MVAFRPRPGVGGTPGRSPGRSGDGQPTQYRARPGTKHALGSRALHTQRNQVELIEGLTATYLFP